MKWIKASERVPEDWQGVIIRNGLGAKYIVSSFMVSLNGIRVPPQYDHNWRWSEFEWLDESDESKECAKESSEYKQFLQSLKTVFTVDPGYIPQPSVFDDLLVGSIPVSQTNVQVEINGLTESQILELIRNTDSMIKHGHVIRLDMRLNHYRSNKF